MVIVARRHLTDEQEAYWASTMGKRLLKRMEPLGPIEKPDEAMLYHFHRFVVEGASDEQAIMGWRYVMATRQRMRVKPKGLSQSK